MIRARLVLVAVAALVSPPAHAQTRYTITDLTPQAGVATAWALGLNDLGQVVGRGDVAGTGETDHAILWDKGLGTDLGLLPGDDRSEARDINTASTAVGTSEHIEIKIVGDKIFYYITDTAMVWSGGVGTPLKDLITGGSPRVPQWLMGINDSGKIVGWATEAETPCACPWHAVGFEDGILTDLGTFGEPADNLSSEAWAVNAQGWVVGNSGTPNFPRGSGHAHAVLWKDGQMLDLHYPEIKGLLSRAYGVNDAGDAVGEAQFDVSHPEEPTLWRDGKAYLLPHLGFQQGIAFAINNAGVAVGTSFLASGEERAALWEDGKVYDLNDLIDGRGGWTVWFAWAINDSGQIAGVGRRDGVEFQAFLLTPVTECRPDCNGDGKLNINDFICFQGEWKRRTSYGDFNGDGVWNVNDFIAFQAEFRKGCP